MSRTFTLTVRELLRSIPDPRFVRLAQVDGLIFPTPLVIESIFPDTRHSDLHYPSVELTVWSPKGWMFGINLAPLAYGDREVTVTFEED